MKRIAATVFLLTLTAPNTAEACRAFQPPEARVLYRYAAVVVGIVERPSAGPRHGTEQGWSATVRVTGTVEGRSTGESYPIGRSGQRAACDDGQAMPRAGERWVVYLSRPVPDGPLVVSQSYPLSLARRIDPRFRE